MIASKRVFLLTGPDGRGLDVVAKLERLSGNRKAHFSVTSRYGSNHEVILVSAPADVAEDLALLVKVHLRDEDGVPMHAVANAAYHLERDDYAAAIYALGGDASVESLVRVKAKAVAEDITGGEKLVSEWAARTRASAERLTALVASGGLPNVPAKNSTYREAMLAFDANYRGAERSTGVDAEAEKRKAEKLEASGILKRAAGVAKDGVARSSLDSMRTRIRTSLLTAAVLSFVETDLVEIWKDDLARARTALEGPDYRAEGRPDPDVDDRTFAGFAKAQRLSVEVEAAGKDGDATKWRGTLSRRDSASRHDFTYTQGSAFRDAPDLERILSSLQSDVACAFGREEDEFVDELGFTGSSASLKKGIQAYEACRQAESDLRAMLGEDGFRHFMTDVGDDPPLTRDSFTDAAPSM